MNLLMCCTPLDRESRYESELRQPILASLFFKRIYPGGKVFVGTTPDAKVPAYCDKFFKVLRFDFRANPWAISRQLFYSRFCESEFLTADTAFTGCDVFFTGEIPELEEHKLLVNYRYHPTQPYCADFLVVRKAHSEYAAKFFYEIALVSTYLPKRIRYYWADQISYMIDLGKLPDGQFDGKRHYAPRMSDVLLVPADTFCYTPNDTFPSEKSRFTGKSLKDVSGPSELLKIMGSKVSLHFKGQRKHWMYMFAYQAFMKRVINPYLNGLDIPVEKLFDEAFEKREADISTSGYNIA